MGTEREEAFKAMQEWKSLSRAQQFSRYGGTGKPVQEAFVATRQRQAGVISEQEYESALAHAGRQMARSMGVVMPHETIATQRGQADFTTIERTTQPLTITDRQKLQQAPPQPPPSAYPSHLEPTKTPRGKQYSMVSPELQREYKIGPEAGLMTEQQFRQGRYEAAKITKFPSVFEGIRHPIQSSRQATKWFGEKAGRLEYSRLQKEMAGATGAAVLYGAGSYTAGAISATGQMFFHPVKTIKATGQAIRHPFETGAQIRKSLIRSPARTMGELTGPPAITYGIVRGGGRLIQAGARAAEARSVRPRITTAEVGQVSRYKAGQATLDLGEFSLGSELTKMRYGLGPKKTIKYAGSGREALTTKKMLLEGGKPTQEYLSTGLGQMDITRVGKKPQTARGGFALTSQTKPVAGVNLLQTQAEWGTAFKFKKTIYGRGGRARAITTREPQLIMKEAGAEVITYPSAGETTLGWTERIKAGKVKTKIREPQLLDVYASAIKKTGIVTGEKVPFGARELWQYQTIRKGGKRAARELMGLETPERGKPYKGTIPKTEEILKQAKEVKPTIERIKRQPKTPTESISGMETITKPKTRPPIEKGMSRSVLKGAAEKMAVEMEKVYIRTQPYKKTRGFLGALQFQGIATTQLREKKITPTPETKLIQMPKVRPTTEQISGRRFALRTSQIAGTGQLSKMFQLQKETQIQKQIQIQRPIQAVRQGQIMRQAQLQKQAQLTKGIQLSRLGYGGGGLRGQRFFMPPPPPAAIWTPPIKPPVMFEGKKKKGKKAKFKTKYFASVEARLKGIRGAKPSKRMIAMGLAMRPIVTRSKTKKKRKKRSRDISGLHEIGL